MLIQGSISAYCNFFFDSPTVWPTWQSGESLPAGPPSVIVWICVHLWCQTSSASFACSQIEESIEEGIQEAEDIIEDELSSEEEEEVVEDEDNVVDDKEATTTEAAALDSLVDLGSVQEVWDWTIKCFVCECESFSRPYKEHINWNGENECTCETPPLECDSTKMEPPQNLWFAQLCVKLAYKSESA